MCAGAIYWAGIGRLVYGLSEHRLRELTGNHPENPTLDLPCREVFASGQRSTEVVGPLLEDEAAAVHAGRLETNSRSQSRSKENGAAGNIAAPSLVTWGTVRWSELHVMPPVDGRIRCRSWCSGRFAASVQTPGIALWSRPNLFCQ